VNAVSLLQSYAAEATASVVIAVSGFLLGMFQRDLSLRLRTRRTRRYWRALRSRGVTALWTAL